MIIRTYGLLWERSLVQWGKRGPGNAGQLLGYYRSPKVTVDFAEQAGIYVLYEGIDPATHRIVYVGQAGRGKRAKGLYARLWRHCSDDLWNRWTRFSWFGTYAVGKQDRLVHTNASKRLRATVADVLDHIEGVLLELMEPPLNSHGPSWKGEATQYYQYAGDDYDPGNPLRSTLRNGTSHGRGA